MPRADAGPAPGPLTGRALQGQERDPSSARSGAPTCRSRVLLVPSLCCSMLLLTQSLSLGVRSSFRSACSSVNCSLALSEPACKLERVPSKNSCLYSIFIMSQKVKQLFYINKKPNLR